METLELFAKIILQKNEFTGLCIFGNPYKLGFEKVKKVINLKF